MKSLYGNAEELHTYKITVYTVRAEMISTFKCCMFEERTLWCSSTNRVGPGRAMIEMSTTGNSITKIYFSVNLTVVDLYVTILGS